MARQKKDVIKFASTMDRTLFEKVQEHSEASGLPITVIIDKALKMYFSSQEENRDLKNELC